MLMRPTQLESKGLTMDRAYTVSSYWPNKSSTVPQVKGVYQKMFSSEMNGKQGSGQDTNGQVNGP